MSASLSFPVFGAVQPVKGHGFDALLTAQAGIAPWHDGPAVTIRRAPGNRGTGTWERGILQTATAVTGPWSESASPSPVVLEATGPHRFFRVRQ